ncbi:hypothetical protein [Dendronalium sp. ChiSLP03b]|uniref:hypothetical protein n=1 Tax=Dendronalium sp. ChiSLP03b TaxID=3075381 RepID=UPI002AD65F67|nr:hypothetical protein [Dendronalium sp. ChiSLP03b]
MVSVIPTLETICYCLIVAFSLAAVYKAFSKTRQAIAPLLPLRSLRLGGSLKTAMPAAGCAYAHE